MIFVSRQSTAGIEAGRTFDYWRSTALSRVAATPVQDARPFAAQRLAVLTSHGTLFHTISSPLIVERRIESIRRDGNDDVSLSLLLGGRGHHEQGSRGGVLSNGGIGIVTNDRPFVSGAPETYEEMRLTVSRSQFSTHVGIPEDVSGRTFQGSGLSVLLTDYLRSLTGSVERMSDAQAAHAFEGAMHLVRGIVNLEGARPRQDLPSMAVRSLVLAYIQRRLHDPSLDPAVVGADLRISRTRLYLAFAQDGGIAAAIRDARLDLVSQRLVSRAWEGETIASIAFASGFRDTGVFGRAFRRRYAMSARDFRHAARG